ncbi:MAG: HAD-IC family P-type ATPase [Anaerolineae bacterium]|nr:HAD-IC family P-type ATPase [Anaerolineae bacterium]
MAQLSPQSTGLTSAQVAERVARGESNHYRSRVGRTYWEIVRDNLLNLFNIVFAALLLTVLWFRDYSTAFFAGFSVVTNTFMGMLQEIFAKRKLDALAMLALSDVRVWRDGAQKVISISEIVKDDVLPLEPGDKIVVDGKLLSGDALEIDESQLPGESDAVMKNEGDPIYSGSFCVAGSGVMVATTVGKASAINRLSDVAKQYKHVLTPTQQRISYLVQLSVVIMAICTPMIFIAGYIQHNTIITLNVFRDAVVFVASIVPQGLVLTAILSLTIGAINISRKQTLVQRVNAVESLANVTTLCFDKTGTLTRNVLRVTEIVPVGRLSEGEVDERLRLYTGNLSHLNRTAAAVADYLNGDKEEQPALPAVVKTSEVPFTSARKWGAIVLPQETLIMGAPERVLCPEDQDAIQRAETLAAQGLRVLALSRSTAAIQDGKLDPHRDSLALIILSDEIRENIQATLSSFERQDVALKVISGDNLETVREIAQQAGMDVSGAYTGDQLEAMSDDELEHAADTGHVFARIEPDTKRKLIRALKRRGHYVAMVGDGVNDVPALKEAHLAVAMNDGAQIAKDIADIVLLNNALTTLPLAFSEGRRITQTIFGTTKIFLVKNFYSLLFFLFTGLMLMPFPLNPIHISWVTFWVINVPATLIAFRLIKPAQMATFRRDVLDFSVTAGLIGAAAMAAVYAFAYLTSDRGLAQARSTVMLFITLFGMICLWHIHGIRLLEPRTIRGNFRVFLLGWALGIPSLVGPYIALRWLEFTPPTNAQWGVVLVVFLVTVVILYVVMRTRWLTDRLWKLFSP